MITRVALGAILLVGCGDDTGGGGGDGGPGDPDAPKPTKTGLVLLQSYTAEQPPGTMLRGGSASATFSSVMSTCVGETVGDCLLADCVKNPPSPASAGTITVTGASLPVSLVPRADKTYAAVAAMQQAFFTGGETVTFAGEGADVPAFTVSVVTPLKATITMPVEPASTSPYLMLDRTYGFTARWTGGGSGEIQIFFSGGTGSNLFINCRFPASAGTGTIPAAVVGRLPAGQGSFAMSANAEAQVIAGDYGVIGSTYFNAVWPDGSIVSGPTMVQ